MAAPADMTTLDLAGVWVMNKNLSDSTDEVLAAQGIGWLTRKAVGIATITLHVKHYKDSEGVEHIDIDQTLTGGIKGTTENRVLNWEQRPHEDHLFGKVVSQSRRVDISEITDPHMNSGWEADWIKEGVIENFVINEDNDWTAAQVWGFEKINGEKRYVRHLILDCPKRKKTLKKKLVYDYTGPEQ